jgi:predicted esterase
MQFLRIFLLACLMLVPAWAQEELIPQVKDGSIAIDGNLVEWPNGEWLPVSVGYDGLPVEPGAGLTVRASFAFDSKKLYLAVRVFDDDFVTVDRSWRYGDGFLLTIVTEEGKDRSRQVYQYGFSQEEKFLVYRNGEYFPRFQSLRELEFRHMQHSDRVDYEIGIPYKLLRSFNPFVYEAVALNIICADRDGNRRRLVMLSHDRDYDTEMSSLRAGRLFKFQVNNALAPEERSAHFRLEKNYFKTSEEIAVDYALNTEAESDLWSVKMELKRNRQTKQRMEETVIVNRGINRGRQSLPVGLLPSGSYNLYLEAKDEQGKMLASQWDRVFILSESTLSEIERELETVRTSEALAPSLPNLDVRLKWFREFYEEKQHYKDISVLDSWFYDILLLRPHLENRTPLVFGPGAIKRYAHRSAIDDTLQPYSVYLPENFDAESPTPLIVGLHGSGVDEQGFMPMLVSRMKTLALPVIAPRGRGLSDYYVGDSGVDVLECIRHFTELYPNIDNERILLIGFSMGGYGAWRLTLLHPDSFRGAIIMSGVVVPPQETGGESVFDLLDGAVDSSFLVVHGDRDNAVPIGGTRRLVGLLRDAGVDITYIEVPGAAHGDYTVDEDLLNWTKRLLLGEQQPPWPGTH